MRIRLPVRVSLVPLTVFVVLLLSSLPAITDAQGLGSTGTVQGTITDATGGVMQAVPVKISNPVSGFSRTTNGG